MADWPQTKRVRLTTRDLQIFEQLLNSRAETLGTLHEQHWPPGTERDSARHRLSRLAAWGFLDKHGLEHVHPNLIHPNDNPDGSGWITVYTLTPKGVNALRRRSLAGSVLRGRSINGDLDQAAIPHQLAGNRIGRLLDTRLTADHLIEVTGDRRHRPDATYTADPDDRGRTIVTLEIDLGHYSRKRILGKLVTFLTDPDTRSVSRRGRSVSRR